MEHKIITIGRQFGSGGREIGELLADRLCIPCYDKQLIEETAHISGISASRLGEVDETTVNPFLFTVPNEDVYRFGTDLPIQDTLFNLQSEFIANKAVLGSCIFIGRCSDYILSKHHRCVHAYIFAPMEARIQRVMNQYNLNREEAKTAIKRRDKKRKAYYNYYTDRKWGEISNYNILLDSCALGTKAIVEILAGMYENM